MPGRLRAMWLRWMADGASPAYENDFQLDRPAGRSRAGREACPPVHMRTTGIGSHRFPGWLKFASQHLHRFGEDDIREMQDDAVIAAIHDQVAAGLDVITDGEQTRLDFNLSFYGYVEGVAVEAAQPRRFGPPAHDQR